jgi:hypothetical protein
VDEQHQPNCSGAELAAAFHREVVAPLVGRELPRLRYAAGRLGSGSDVLGLDDGRSRDHDWGLRLTLLVDEADRTAVPMLSDLLDRELPGEFRGLPVRFPTTWDPAASHRVSVDTVADFAAGRLGVSGQAAADGLAGLSSLDWLTLTGQGVLEITAGPVYADETAGLAAVRRRLSWYPPDVERYVLACGWNRLAQRMPFVGRTADTGQPLGSRLLCAGLAADVISLAFLLHRRWEPYEKWREAVFSRLPSAASLAGPLEALCGAAAWADREAGLAACVEVLAGVQRRAGLPTPEQAVTQFFDRPYRTVSGQLSRMLLAQVTDPVLARLGVRAGSAAQWVDSVDVLAHPSRRAPLAAVYRSWLEDPRARRRPC